MGKSSTVTVGYIENMGLHMGFCAGPVDSLLEITGDDKTAWSGDQTESGEIFVQMANLYGGDRKEGGLFGKFIVMMGEATQGISTYLSNKQSGPQVAYRELFTGVFHGEVGATNPYIKPIGVRVRRALMGWFADECWEPTLALVDRGMNPAHIIVQCYTDPRLSDAMDMSDLDLDSFRAAAVRLKDEDFGLCLGYRLSTPISQFVATVCDHIGGVIVEDPETLKQQLVLIRGDYDVDDLVQVDESNIIDLVRFQQTLLSDTVNQVVVKYHTMPDGVDANTAPAVNLANIQAQGRVIGDSVEYPGFYKASQADRAAARDCHAKSCLPAAVELVVKSKLWRIKRGDVIAFSWSRKGIVKMPLRVLEVSRGDRPNRPIQLTCVQDQYGLPVTTYVAEQPTQWVPPDTTPHPITVQRVWEAPYRDLAHRLRQADLNALTADAGYLVALGARPDGVNYNFGIKTKVGSAAYAPAGAGDFCPGGLLAAALPAGAEPVAVALTGFVDLDLIAIGRAALIDDEVVRIDDINADTGVVTIARGCGDTVAADHALGARLWCYEDHAGYSSTEYVGGETVDAVLLTRTSQGELDPAEATPLSLAFGDRQIRPYPPGNLKIGGDAYPSTVLDTVSLSWSHRDRLLQADQLIDTQQSDIGPETDVTYTLRTYLNGSLESTTTGITATTATPVFSSGGTARVEIDAVRSSLTSWQSLVASFTLLVSSITKALLHGDGTSGSTVMTDTAPKLQKWTAAAGAAASAAQSKFGGSSFYFDGVNGSISAAVGSANVMAGDFTVEGWAYADDFTEPRCLLDTRAVLPAGRAFAVAVQADGKVYVFTAIDGTKRVGTIVVAAGNWFHWAVCRNGGTVRLFVNGAVALTFTASTVYDTGCMLLGRTIDASGFRWKGYLQDFRCKPRTAMYIAAFTPPAAPLPDNLTDDSGFNATSQLLKLNGIAGDGVVVNSADKFTMAWSAVGTSAISTAQSKFGGASIRLPGSSAVVSPIDASMSMGNGDFTWECFFRYDSLAATQTIICNRVDAGAHTDQITFGINAAGQLYVYSNTFLIQAASGIAVNTWAHIALSVAAHVGRIFVGGVQIGSTFTVPALVNNQMAIGANIDGTAGMVGYIDEARITKGQALYPSTFAPPTAPFTDP